MSKWAVGAGQGWVVAAKGVHASGWVDTRGLGRASSAQALPECSVTPHGKEVMGCNPK